MKHIPRCALAQVVALALSGALLVGCSATGRATGSPSSPAVSEKPTLKTAMVADVDELGDRSFNDLARLGLEKAKAELGIETRVLESKQTTDHESDLRLLASAGFSPVFAVGSPMSDTVTRMATATPGTDYVGVDILFSEPPKNVVGLTFRQEEAGYLAGVVAGLATKETFDERLNPDNVIGFVGTVPIPSVRRLEAGFVAGARSVDPDIRIISFYTGTFDDQAKGEALGVQLIANRCDVIFAAAGRMCLGTIKACRERKALFIGSESDRFLMAAGSGDVVLTSAVKRVDNAVFQLLEQTAGGEFPGGRNLSFGIAEDGVGLAPYHDFEGRVPATIKDAVARAGEGIADGTIALP